MPEKPDDHIEPIPPTDQQVMNKEQDLASEVLPSANSLTDDNSILISFSSVNEYVTPEKEAVGGFPPANERVTKKEIIQVRLDDTVALDLTPEAHTALNAIIQDFLSRVFEEARQANVEEAIGRGPGSFKSKIEVHHIHTGHAHAKARLARRTGTQGRIVQIAREIIPVGIGAGLGYMPTDPILGSIVLAVFSIGYGLVYRLEEWFRNS